MAPIAAVMTGPGAGAIATIQLFGDSAEAVLRGIFLQADRRPFEFVAGRVFLGEIVEGQRPIDQVTVGCEGPDAFAIHCHGNPLIVERIMGLLHRHGVQSVRAEQLLATMTSRDAADAIAVEARLALTAVKTIEGARIIANQVNSGLAAKARQWLAALDSTPLEEITAEAKQVLHDRDKARLIISSCTLALVGPPNTGKSTLLNTLAGREKAIVTDIRGTTRDWVTAEIRIPPLAATVIDTAGLDSVLAATGDIDQTAQHKSIEALNHADLVLLILDASQPAGQLSESVADLLIGRRTITVLNKADLPLKLDMNSLPAHLRHIVYISAKKETGIEDLIRVIHETCGVLSLDPNTAVTFTDRQRILVERLATASSPSEAFSSVVELLHGRIT
ncbi:MAG: GTPase [Solirubrobacterales bacterium]